MTSPKVTIVFIGDGWAHLRRVPRWIATSRRDGQTIGGEAALTALFGDELNRRPTLYHASGFFGKGNWKEIQGTDLGTMVDRDVPVRWPITQCAERIKHLCEAPWYARTCLLFPPWATCRPLEFGHLVKVPTVQSSTAQGTTLGECDKRNDPYSIRRFLSKFGEMEAAQIVVAALEEDLDKRPAQRSAMTAPLARGALAREQLKQEEGGSLSAEAARQLLGLSKESVLKRYRKSALLGWREARQDAVRFPAWQFSEVTAEETIVCNLTLASVWTSMGCDLSALMHHDLVIPQAWATAIQAHSAKFDGILYASRFTGKRCAAFFAPPSEPASFQTSQGIPLCEHPSALEFLTTNRIALV